MTKIEELESKVAELQKEIDKLKSGSDTNVGSRWIPKNGEEFWYLDSCGEVENDVWEGHSVDKYSLAIHNIYRTKEIAERMHDYYLALEEARWYPTEEEWEDEDLSKYYGYYDHEDKKIGIGHNTVCQSSNAPYFKTEECKAFYDKWQAESLIDWGIRSEL